MRFGARTAARQGFTLAEVLAALLFMAILIPVTMEAVRIASRAGQVGDRKAAATQVAESILNETLVTGALGQSTSSGQVEERQSTYHWVLRSEPWREDQMNVVTVTVTYEVQNAEYGVTLATLYDSTESVPEPNQ